MGKEEQHKKITVLLHVSKEPNHVCGETLRPVHFSTDLFTVLLEWATVNAEIAYWLLEARLRFYKPSEGDTSRLQFLPV